MLEFIEIPNNEQSKASLFQRLKGSSLGQFYSRHIKKYSLLRALVSICWRYTYPIIQRLIQHRKSSWKSIESIESYASRKALEGYTLLQYCEYAVTVKNVLPKDFEALESDTTFHRDFPAISLYPLDGATVFGGSNLVNINDVVIHHNLANFSTDYTSEELHGRLVIKPEKKLLEWFETDESPEVLAEAAVFLDATSHNYAHWFTEVLSKIVMFCSDSRFENIPLVVDSGLHPNLMESLFLVAGERKVYLLPKGRGLKIEKLFYTSACGYVPFQPRKKTFRTHGEFSPLALDKIRRLFSKAIAPIHDVSPKKIYLRRNSGLRNIFNADEVEQLLLEHGYTIVEPEKLTFKEQYLLFQNADSIIAATGAALANCIFCKPGTEVTVLISDHKEMIYYYWSNMLSPLGLNINYLICDRVGNDSLSIHADFNVDKSLLTKHLLCLAIREKGAHIDSSARISPYAEIGDNVSIGANTIIHANVVIGSNSKIGAFCELGIETPLGDKSPLVIGEKSLIRSNSVFYESSSFGPGLVTGHSVIVRENTIAGCNFQIGTNSEIQGDCKIGNYVRFQSNVFVGKKTTINDYVWVLPGVTFTNDPTPPSETLIGAYVDNYACISAGALILPGVKVGESSLVAAAACVTKDVPSGKVVAGNPAKIIKDTSEIKLRDGSEQPAYPWTNHFHRGYPDKVISEWKKK